MILLIKPVQKSGFFSLTPYCRQQIGRQTAKINRLGTLF